MKEPFSKLKEYALFSNQRGIALLLVLFVTMLLIILAAEFAYTTRMEISVAGNFKEDIEGYYYGLAGMQYAMTEILGKYDDTYLGPGGQVGFFRSWLHDSPEGSNRNDKGEIVEWPAIPNREKIPIGSGGFDYIISDEEGRLNINYLTSNARTGSKNNRQIFRELLVATGVEDGEPADIIADSIMDWTDRNDLHRLNGAETEWYEKNYEKQGFSEPYECKNGRIDTLDELLMIQGMTPAILYGSDSMYANSSEDDTQYTGIAPYITVYGYSRRVNTQTAPPLLLKILDPDNVDDLLEQRADPSKKRRNPSRTFRIEVRGYKLGSRVSHGIMAVVRSSRSRANGGGAEIIYWNDNLLDFGSGLDVANLDVSGDDLL